MTLLSPASRPRKGGSRLDLCFRRRPRFSASTPSPNCGNRSPARLERYIIADDATLEDVTAEECLFHLSAGGGAVRAANREE